MKQELEEDYDVTCDNLVDIDKCVGDFETIDGEFYDIKTEDFVVIKILCNHYDKQIFKSKDGRYILEVEVESENGLDVEYFWSNDINDLA